MNKLINKIPNSNFEQLEYNSSGISIKDWIVDKSQVCDSNARSGGYCLILNNANTASPIKCTINNFNRNHIYYLRIYAKSNPNSSSTVRVKYSFIQESNSEIINSNNMRIINNMDWSSFSFYINKSSNKKTNDTVSFNLNHISDVVDNNRALIDSILLVDLTETFQKKYEPLKNWCDNNIPYFTNEFEVDYLPKDLEFIKDDIFVYDKFTKKYYTNEREHDVKFVIKNINLICDTTDIPNLLNKIGFDYFSTIIKDNSPHVLMHSLHLDNNQYELKDNDLYVTQHVEFDNHRHHAIFKIYTDLFGNYKSEDNVTVYYTRGLEEFDCNLDYNLSYSSVYLRQLNGIIQCSSDLPINIDVFINSVKTSPVNINIENDNTISFNKDLYLSDGNNLIEVVVTDIFGNIRTKSSNIYVDCMTPIPEKEDLLTNFIGNDDLKLSLHLGSTDLRYKNKSAGLQKDILIDTDITSHYFELTGDNANFYRISRNNIPKIRGDIIKRPLSIVFDSVEKIYDGNTDITPEVKRLKLDDGYYLLDVHKEYNDYANSGLVRGTFERRVTSETVCNQYDNILNEYVLNEFNIDLSTVYLNIDEHDGYSLFNEFENEAEIIFNDDFNDQFESIKLLKQDNKTILKFNYHENTELLYKVKNSVNIKYNYSNNSDSEYVTYKNSDIGCLQVTFNNAFFKSKDITNDGLITLNNIAFSGDISGDASNNYQIANYSIMGKILKRTIYPHVECLDKVYDGSVIAPFKMSDEYYRGLENSILNDDIYVDTTYKGDKDDDTHIFIKSNSSIVVFEDADVGTNKRVNINSLYLEGPDAHNYKIGNITSNYQASIRKRPIEIVINELRFIRSTRTWEINYTILNDIKTDNLTMIYNTNDNLDIKVYGGLDMSGNSIHNDYIGKPDIITMFFNYPFNSNYQFKNIDTEVTKLSDNLLTAYYKDEARPAEPDTERYDMIIEDNNSNEDYPHQIETSLKPIMNGTQTAYFESENKEYIIYSGCKVMVTNINLNPLNKKLKNYTIKNSMYETEIKII